MARVKLVLGPNGGRFPGCNCLLVEDVGVRVLVDTGCGDALLHLRDRVDAVVYTHHHPDHISGHHLIPRGVNVYSPIGEEPYGSLEDLARRYAAQVHREWLDFATSYIGVKEAPRATHYFEPGEDVCIKGLCIKTIAAPGHMRTHTLLQVDGHAHLTDIDLAGFGPWYGNPESSLTLFLADIEAAARIDADAFTTSHKPQAYVRGEALNLLLRYALRVIDTLRALMSHLEEAGAARPADLAGRGIVYRRYLPIAETIMRFFEENMLAQLLGLLHTLGCVKRTPRGFSAARGCQAIDRLEERIRDAVMGYS